MSSPELLLVADAPLLGLSGNARRRDLTRSRCRRSWPSPEACVELCCRAEWGASRSDERGEGAGADARSELPGQARAWRAQHSPSSTAAPSRSPLLRPNEAERDGNFVVTLGLHFSAGRRDDWATFSSLLQAGWQSSGEHTGLGLLRRGTPKPVARPISGTSTLLATPRRAPMSLSVRSRGPPAAVRDPLRICWLDAHAAWSRGLDQDSVVAPIQASAPSTVTRGSSFPSFLPSCARRARGEAKPSSLRLRHDARCRPRQTRLQAYHTRAAVLPVDLSSRRPAAQCPIEEFLPPLSTVDR